jgi:hypothetical protein
MRPSRQPFALASLIVAAVAAPALAQQPSSAYPPACDASKVTKAEVDRAHTVFLSGKQFLEESNYDKAISYFKDAYSIDCSIHAILPIIATAYERKGDKAEAVRALEEYQRRAPSAPDHEVIDRRIHNLKDQLSHEQPPPAASSAPVTPPPSASASPTPAPAPAASGPSAATPPPTPTSTGSSQAAPSGPQTPEGGHSSAPWVLVGVGGAAVVAGVVLYAIGAGKVSSAENNCPGHVCNAGDTADVQKGNDGRSLETAGGVVLGVGAAAAAAGLVWHFMEPTTPTSSSGARTRVTPVIGGPGGFAGLSIAGSF